MVGSKDIEMMAMIYCIDDGSNSNDFVRRRRKIWSSCHRVTKQDHFLAILAWDRFWYSNANPNLNAPLFTLSLSLLQFAICLQLATTMKQQTAVLYYLLCIDGGLCIPAH